MDKSYSKQTCFLNSILLAFIIDTPALNLILSTYVPNFEGSFLMLMFEISAVGIIVSGFFSVRYRVERKLALFCLFILTGYFLTVIFASYTDLSVSHFFCYTIFSIIAVMFLKVDSRITLRTTMILTCFGIPIINKLFNASGYNYETISMGLSYAFMPAIIGTIIYMYVYYKQDSKGEKVIDVVFAIVNLLYAFRIFQFGSRGVVLTILCGLAYVFCFYYDSTNNRIWFKGWKVLVLFAILVIVVMNATVVLKAIEMWIESLGLHINAINKIFRLIDSTGDISNGRMDIYLVTLKGIIESPIYGHGYSTTAHNLGINYPHNFFLQLLYDGGLVLTVPITTMVVTGIKNWSENCSKAEYSLIAFLIIISIPGALFSGNLWENNRLWITFAVLASYKTNKWISDYIK